MKQFQAVIFDLDGLLLDTENIALSAFLDTCTHFKLPLLEEVFIRCIGTNQSRGRELLEDGLRGQVDHLAFREMWDRFLERAMDKPIPLKEGAVELLNHISAIPIPLAVATSTHTNGAREKLHMAGILDRFAVVVGGDQVAYSKPAPEIYLRAAEILGVAPTACLALEDSENGVRAAISAGMTVVQIPDLVQPSVALRALGHIVLRTLGDVATFPFDLGQAQDNSTGMS
ncbi:MAG: HAD family phosphatase [Nitrospira sp.]|nr:HAD family phosphatase [Nitrospira sp.]